MKKKYRKLFLMLLGFFFTFGVMGELPQALADPPPWAPAHGWRAKHGKPHKRYAYYYYPAQQVYYSVERRGYYYLDGNNWIFNVQLPNTIQLGKKVSVSLGTPYPYVVHPTVVKTYPVIIER